MPAGLWKTVLASEAAATAPAFARPTCRLSCTGKEKPLAPAEPDRPTPRRSGSATAVIRVTTAATLARVLMNAPAARGPPLIGPVPKIPP